MNVNKTTIARHKTAIKRPSYSLPISCLLRDGLVHAETSFFDYGCGHGQDIELLRGAGIHGDGWDPAHRADGQKRPADVVNLGYVINVIEDARERAAAVRAAWELSHKLLVVAAQIEFAAPDKELPRSADGVLTSRGTFQKYYTQTELRAYLETELATDAIPAAPGVFYVFKDEATKQQFLATRFHRRISLASAFRLGNRLGNGCHAEAAPCPRPTSRWIEVNVTQAFHGVRLIFDGGGCTSGPTQRTATRSSSSSHRWRSRASRAMPRRFHPRLVASYNPFSMSIRKGRAVACDCDAAIARTSRPDHALCLDPALLPWPRARAKRFVPRSVPVESIKSSHRLQGTTSSVSLFQLPNSRRRPMTAIPTELGGELE